MKYIRPVLYNIYNRVNKLPNVYTPANIILGEINMNDLQAKRTNGLPGRMQCISGYALKMIGVIFMVMDHIHQMFYLNGAPMWLTMAGRIVLPIFLFMVSEGYYYTRNKKQYMLRLLAAFWLMGIANQIISAAFPVEGVLLINGIFGTMFLSVFFMWAIDALLAAIKAQNAKTILLATGVLLLPVIAAIPIFFLNSLPIIILQLYIILIPSVFTVEAGIFGIALAVGFRYLRNYRWLQVLLLALFSLPSLLKGDIQWMMIFAAIPILMYNGKPGRKSKYFFYIFYPAHIYLLYMISYFIQK